MIRRSLALTLALLSSPGLGVAFEPNDPGGSNAVSPPPLREVVKRWLDAVGGEARVRRARRVVFSGDTTADGVAGRVEESLEGDSWRRVSVQGSRMSESSCLTAVAWHRDWNGQVAELQGRDRRDQLTEARIQALVFGGALAGLLSSGEAELIGEDDARTSWVVRVTPRDGVPFDVHLDRTTSLPAKVVRKPYDDVITTGFSDWRGVRGRKVPFSVIEVEGEADDGAATAVREIASRGRHGAGTIRRPEGGAKDTRFDSGNAALGIPFNFENDHIMVRGEINGRDAHWFMLDTGAEATIVNRARLEELGLTPFGASSISGGGNATDFALTEVARLRVGSVELLNQRDGVIDLGGLERIYGMPIGGILGYDFFSRFVVRVSYDAKTIDLLDPQDYVYRGVGTRVPFVLEQGQPHVTATIALTSGPPIPADLIVDCGAADNVNLTSPFVKAHQLLERARKSPTGGPNTMAGSEKEFFAQTSVRGKLAGLSLGSRTFKEVPTNLMVGTTGAYASDAFSGTIGEGVLHRFNTIYDYARSVMILEPNAELEKPFPPRRTFGATLLSEGPEYRRFTVTGVRKESPAAAAGLMKGDVVLAVDGKAAQGLRLADLRRLLADEGAHRVLDIRRGDEELSIEADVKLVSLDEN